MLCIEQAVQDQAPSSVEPHEVIFLYFGNVTFQDTSSWFFQLILKLNQPLVSLESPFKIPP